MIKVVDERRENYTLSSNYSSEDIKRVLDRIKEKLDTVECCCVYDDITFDLSLTRGEIRVLLAIIEEYESNKRNK